MKAAIDFGISNTDMAILNNDDLSFYSLPSKKNTLNCLSIKNIFSQLNIPLESINIIGVTIMTPPINIKVHIIIFFGFSCSSFSIMASFLCMAIPG